MKKHELKAAISEVTTEINGVPICLFFVPNFMLNENYIFFYACQN